MSTVWTGAFLCTCALLSGITPAAAQERIAEVRVHGNHTTPDADILAIAGLRVGDEASEATLDAASRKLGESGRFAGVDVRRRYVSISDPSQILIMIVVEERAGISDADLTPGLMKRVGAASMWLPILSYADGYGFTYGARLTFADALGPNTRVSMPFTWGGERRAGVELERRFGGTDTSGPRPPSLRVVGGVAEYRRVNPFYRIADTRLEGRARVERPFTSWLRAGAGVRSARVDFNGASDRHDAAGADLVVDTRLDPSFPRNAVYVEAGWEHLRFADAAARRWMTDARGYLGVGPTIVGVRAHSITSDVSLPASEQPLLGGGDTLRGYRAGHRVGDNLAAVSAELRLPLNSPLTVGRFGVKTFVDWGTTWASGDRLRDQQWDRGIGAGIYFGAGPLIGDLAVAWPKSGSPRTTFGLGVSF
jgi:outer membrane protein assembly factor BamA